MSSLGFLGLGRMGSAMAGRLVGDGHELHVWNRSPAAVERLVDAGAVAVAEAGDALGTDISFSMLADDQAAESVLDAAGAARASGRIHVNMASVSPAAADRLEARFVDAGARYISAPVLGRSTVAAEGKLNILVAGPAEAVQSALPYLEMMGVRLWRLGERPRIANVAKVVVNYNIIHAIQALGESVALVERQGLSPADFVELLTSTLFSGVSYTGYGQEIVDQTYDPPGFRMALGFKDLTLAEEVARETDVRLPTGPALRRVFERALADPDLAELDWGAAAEVTRRGLL